jgi:hypothetical protein
MFDTLSRRSNISPLIPFEWIIKNPLIWDQKHIENEKKWRCVIIRSERIAVGYY